LSEIVLAIFIYERGSQDCIDSSPRR